jgi:hypothetical protein
MSRAERKHNKNASEKELMKLYRRQNYLYREMGKLGYRELEIPIRHGYEKRYVLRSDIARSKKAHFLNSILSLVNNPIHSGSKKFLNKDYETKKYIPMEHKLGYISKKEYGLLTPKKQSYFNEYYNRGWKVNYVFVGYTLNLPMWMFSTKIKSHYIYRVKITDDEMQDEYDEIRNYFSTNNLWIKIDHVLGISQNYDDWWVTGRIAKDRDLRIEADKEIVEAYYSYISHNREN